MKKFYIKFMILCVFLFSTSIFAQTASVTWALDNTAQLTSASLGNVTGSAESISSGSGQFGMSVFDYSNDGQRLWEGTAGWIAGAEELTRYIEFNAVPASGNSLTVTNVSFNYGAAGINGHIESNAWYSTDGWQNRTKLNTSGVLAYPNPAMLSFSTTISVTIASGSTFSLRIYPYAILNSVASNPTFAVHNNVVVSGSTAPEVLNNGSICGIKFNDLNGDGDQDPNEPILPNWEINLSFVQASGLVFLTDITDANGNYCFDDLQPGSYRIWETQQPLWQQTFPAYPGVYGVILASGEHRDSLNFGNRLSPVGGICDSLNATASRITPGDCVWSLSLHHPATVTGISSIQILALSPNQFTTGTGLGANYQTWFTSGTNTFTPPTGIVPGGNLNDFFTMSLSYVTSPQIIVVNWLNDLGSVVCSDTLLLDCDISCTTIISDTVTCVGNNYNFAYTFTNNATYTVSNIVYTLQSPPNVTIAPLTAILSPQVASGSNSTLQNILISGALPGDIVSILARYNSPDGCCWCYDTLKIIIPICGSVCDSVSVQAQGSPTDCCYDISLTNNSSTVFSNIEFELLSGGMYSTYATTSVPGWAFTNIFPNNLINLVKFPIAQGIGNGTFNNVLDLCIRQYSSPNQVIEVRWIKDGQVICRDTLRFECESLSIPIDSCSQVINDTLICLPNGTVQYNFQVQNNSNINATGYGIHPTTPGVIFSNTLFNISIMAGQVSPMNSIIISGIGQGQNLCFYTAIFTTVVPGDSLYNWCCHSDTMCITTPNCGGQVGCVEPPTGMVAWWPLDETSGLTSVDIAGFNNSGTHTNSPIPVPAKVLGGLQFDGINDYVEVPDYSELNFGIDDFSIDAWVKTSDSTGIKIIVDKQTLTGYNYQGYSFYLNAGYLTVQLADGIAPTYFTNWSAFLFVADGNWHHVAVTVARNLPNGILFYMDGVATQFGNPTVRPGTLDNTSPLMIGKQSYTNQFEFNGVLDEIEMFNRVLTNAEIVSIFAADSAGKCKTTEQDSCSSKVWSPLGVGTNNGTNGEVWALAVIGSDLYVGGNFTTAGGNTANHIAKWNGSSWSALISSSSGVNGINGMVSALAVIGTDLYAGGWFTDAGGIPAENIAKWDGTNWSALGNGLQAAGAINALAAMGNNLYATSYILDPALGGPENLIVKWDGSNWSLFSVMDDYVSSFLVDGSNLYAGGQFTIAGTVPANHIAKWDGTNWFPLGLGTNYFIGGTGLKMMAGNLYAGGRFTTADNNLANFIARWDGSNWSPFLSGINNGMNNAVEGLAVMGTDLYASGSFTTAGGVNANSVAKWNGTSWSPLGSGMNDGVWRLAVIGNDLYAGGIFTTAGNVSANYIAKYSCDVPTSVGQDNTEKTLPTSFKLEQNYPNPFNPTATIRYAIPMTSYVKISVFDILGKEVRVLVNEQKSPGSYEIIFNAKDLASGIYYYTIMAGDFAQSKKMILLK